MAEREKEDPSVIYMRRFEKKLRIRDRSTRDQILGEIESRVISLERRGKGYDGIETVMGPPEEIAETLSNPDNWYVDLGTPTSPLVPVESFISKRGKVMLASAFLLALLLSFTMVLTGEFGLLVPVILAFTITLWSLMAAWLNQYLGYILTYKKMKNGDLKVSGISQKSMIISVWKHYFFSITLSIVLIIFPFLFDKDSLFFSVPLGTITIFGAVTMALIITLESNKTLEGS